MRAPLVVALLVASVVLLALAAGVGIGSARASPNAAPNFTLTTIDGANFTLSNYRGSAVVLEFTSLSCAECQVVEQALHSVYGNYNSTGTTPVHFLSIYIEPQYGDTISALKSYRASHAITWAMAQDTDSLTVYNLYGVTDIPTVFVIDKTGHAVYEASGAPAADAGQLQSKISSALAGTAPAISIVTVSVFALAAIAGVTTFFSPCAFPMLPGYMGIFLGLNASSAARAPGASAFGTNYRGAVRRALSLGTMSALGMLVVFLLIGVALILAANLVGGYIPYFLVVVGGILIVLGALLLTNLQYWRIVTPFQRLWARIRGRSAGAVAPETPTADAKGLPLKLFGYGMGYAAAAAGCVAPVILAAIVAGMAVGLTDGVLSILIYSATAALLMVFVTVLLAVAGRRYVKQLVAFTPIIKKVSAAALLIVGLYLIYFYYTAWIA